nr:hypothetical protein [Pandoravirus massiliensis]
MAANGDIYASKDVDDARMSVAYQVALPLDMQDMVMRRLAVIDPRTALNLMSTSTTQRALGRSPPGALKALGGMFVDRGASATLGDYVRASIALGAHGDSRIATLVQIQWLMMAYARLIYSSLRARMLVAPSISETPFPPDRDDTFSGTHAFVSVDYVRDWYAWVADAEPLGGASPLADEWKKATEGTGRPGPSVQMAVDKLSSWGVEAGRGVDPVRLDGDHPTPVAGFEDETLARFISSSGTVQGNVTAQEIALWRTTKPRGSLLGVRQILGCPQAAVAIRRHLSSAVAGHMCERGRRIETMTPLAFPRFTDVFGARIVFGPTHVDTLLSVAVRSSVVEDLLREKPSP